MRKLLLAYDGTEPARRALAMAADMTRRFGAELSVISVVPRHAGMFAGDPWDDASAHAEVLIEARRLLRDEGVEAELLEPIGEVPQTIERIAEEGGFDAVILGSRGLEVMDRALLGSVSEHVAANARTTVVVAR
jgi:nucleotide-binding universal stress UspA family protein